MFLHKVILPVFIMLVSIGATNVVQGSSRQDSNQQVALVPSGQQISMFMAHMQPSVQASTKRKQSPTKLFGHDQLAPNSSALGFPPYVPMTVEVRIEDMILAAQKLLDQLNYVVSASRADYNIRREYLANNPNLPVIEKMLIGAEMETIYLVNQSHWNELQKTIQFIQMGGVEQYFKTKKQ